MHGLENIVSVLQLINDNTFPMRKRIKEAMLLLTRLDTDQIANIEPDILDNIKNATLFLGQQLQQLLEDNAILAAEEIENMTHLAIKITDLSFKIAERIGKKALICIPRDEIEVRIKKVANDIINDRSIEPNPLFLVLQEGGADFGHDLHSELLKAGFKLEYASMKTASYIGMESSGNVELIGFKASVLGRTVLIVDDVWETGRTINSVTRDMYLRGASCVRHAVFVDKPFKRVNHEVTEENEKTDRNPFIGYSWAVDENPFLLGRGMGLDELLRDLRDICIPSPETLPTPLEEEIRRLIKPLNKLVYQHNQTTYAASKTNAASQNTAKVIVASSTTPSLCRQSAIVPISYSPMYNLYPDNSNKKTSSGNIPCASSQDSATNIVT